MDLTRWNLSTGSHSLATYVVKLSRLSVSTLTLNIATPFIGYISYNLSRWIQSFFSCYIPNFTQFRAFTVDWDAPETEMVKDEARAKVPSYGAGEVSLSEIPANLFIGERVPCQLFGGAATLRIEKLPTLAMVAGFWLRYSYRNTTAIFSIR